MKRIDRFSGVHAAHGDSHGPHGHHHHPPEEMHNADVAHEDSDVNLGAIGWSAVIVAVTCIGTAVFIYGLFWWVFITQADARDPKLSPLAMPATVMPNTTNASPEFGSAPEPRLLTNEPSYLKGVRDREQQTLHGYAWVDQGAGVARIPIEEAKKLTLERGLAVRPDPTTDPRLGTHAPAYGESSSGRMITQAPSAPADAAPAAPAAAPATEHKPAGHK
jgi:hypothetical protein